MILPQWVYLWHPLWSVVIILRSWNIRLFVIIQTPTATILHVPYSIRPLLVEVLALKFHNAHSKGV